MYKWYIKAFEDSQTFISTMSPDIYGNIVTIEYMGPKFNGKVSDPIEREAGIVLHGSLQMEIPRELRTPEGFKHIFQALPVIEGLVAYPSSGLSPMKIRAEMFEGINWGNALPTFTKTYGHTGTGLSKEVLVPLNT
jgi:hypothetical protein